MDPKVKPNVILDSILTLIPSPYPTMDPRNEPYVFPDSILTIIPSPDPMMDSSNKSNVIWDSFITIDPNYNSILVPTPPSSNITKVILNNAIPNNDILHQFLKWKSLLGSFTYHLNSSKACLLSFMDSNLFPSFDYWYDSSLFYFLTTI